MPFVVGNFGFAVPIRYWTAGIEGNKVVITQLVVAYAKAEKFTAVPGGNHPSDGCFNPGQDGKFCHIRFGVMVVFHRNVVRLSASELHSLCNFALDCFLFALDYTIITVSG